MFSNDTVQDKINNKTKPVGSLGRLEEIAFQIAKIQKTDSPELNNPTILVFAADHGIADMGVSPFPKEVTAQMVMNFLHGGAAINVFCKQNGINLKVIDAGVDYNFGDIETLVHAKIRRGTNNILEGPAMSMNELELALESASSIVQTEYDKGCNIIGFGEMGIGNTSSASLLMHKYCGIPIEDCVGKGTGANGEGLKNKLNILRKASINHTSARSAKEILAAFGGLEIAMIAGAMLKAKALNMAILVDGFIATSALLAARAIDSSVTENCIYCHQSNEKGHKMMLEFLNARGILDLEMRLGEGTGAAVAYPILKSAVSFLNEMASFDDAGVSNAG